MRPAREIRTVITLVALTTSACATAGRSAEVEYYSSTTGDIRPPVRSPGRIVAADLANVQGLTAMDAVRQLRPEFLRATGRQASVSSTPPEASVYENDRYAGGIDVLNRFPLRVIAEIRRVEAVEAKARYGTACPCDGGVILVRTQW